MVYHHVQLLSNCFNQRDHMASVQIGYGVLSMADADVPHLALCVTSNASEAPPGQLGQ